MCSKV